MKVLSITADTMTLLYETGDHPAHVGDQFEVCQTSDNAGLLVQVIANEMSEASHHAADTSRLPSESGARLMAITKIRKRIVENEWRSWDGWVPTGEVRVESIASSEVFRRLNIAARCPLSVVSLDDGALQFDAGRLDMINVVTGIKGSGKSHLAKNILMQLAALGVPCVAFDVNREYVALPGAQVLRWGENFRPDLLEVGFDVLNAVVAGVHALTNPNAIAVFENRGPQIFADRIEFFGGPESAFLSVPDLMQNTAQFRAEELITTEIANRLRSVDNLHLFARTPEERVSLKRLYYEAATKGGIIVFDLHDLRDALRRTLVEAVLQHLEDICDEEHASRAGRFPFVFFEEAHFYIDEAAIISIITRGRHIGIAPFFITNTPGKLPEAVFRQVDNMFVLQLLHSSDVLHVCKSALTDEATIAAMVTRMPQHHALVVGKVTNSYPLVVRVNPLPAEVAPTGRTRSTWDRFAAKS